MQPESYRETGVDIRGGEAFSDFIRTLDSPAVSAAIGGFAGGVPLRVGNMKKPLLLTSTDGVGTKLLVAQALDRYDTIGIDLVAMCVNDLAVCGATPIAFLDYIACGSLDRRRLDDVMRGIVRGCELAGTTLAGGETAEMPDMYSADSFDLAGFTVGVVDEERLLPQLDRIQAGDLLLGLPSSGIHSNGLSLARKTLPKERWEALLTPTTIYVSVLASLIQTGQVKAAAHITGGGLESNTARVLPDGLKPAVTWEWEYAGVFDEIRQSGKIAEPEMRAVFNMGVGIALVCSGQARETLDTAAAEHGYALIELGAVVNG